MDGPILIATALPAVINVDIHVTGSLHPAGHKSIRSRANVFLSHFAMKVIPRIPAHGWSAGKLATLPVCSSSKAVQDNSTNPPTRDLAVNSLFHNRPPGPRAFTP